MTMGKAKVEKSSQLSAGGESEQTENKRLKDRAVSQGLFGRARADAEHLLRPSKRELSYTTIGGTRCEDYVQQA